MANKKRGRNIVHFQRTKVVNTNRQFDYEVWRRSQTLPDDNDPQSPLAQANPDCLTAPEVLGYKPDITKKYRALCRRAKKVLTDTQWDVFHFVGQMGMSYRETAKVLEQLWHQPVSAVIVAAIWRGTLKRLRGME